MMPSQRSVKLVGQAITLCIMVHSLNSEFYLSIILKMERTSHGVSIAGACSQAYLLFFISVYMLSANRRACKKGGGLGTRLHVQCIHAHQVLSDKFCCKCTTKIMHAGASYKMPLVLLSLRLSLFSHLIIVLIAVYGGQQMQYSNISSTAFQLVLLL